MKKLLIMILTGMFLTSDGLASQESPKVKTALLIVDIQQFYFPGSGPGLVNAAEASLAAREILLLFREKRQLVVHVRHKASSGFEIHPNVAPLPDEMVITKEEVNSFKGTGLQDYLKANQVTRLVIIGMQTHMCLEAAVRAAHDLDYECIVVKDACATRNLTFGDKTVAAADVHAAVLATIASGRYGKVISLEEFRDHPDQYLFQENY